MNNKNKLDYHFFDQYFNSFNIIFYAVVGFSILLFAVIFLNIKQQGGLNTSFGGNDSQWYYLAAVICLLFIWPAYSLYRKHLKGALQKGSLREKLEVFRSASLIKYAFLEAGNLIALALLFLTKEQLYLIVYAIMLIMFTINRPTPLRITRDLRLSGEEKDRIRNYRKGWDD